MKSRQTNFVQRSVLGGSVFGADTRGVSRQPTPSTPPTRQKPLFSSADIPHVPSRGEDFSFAGFKDLRHVSEEVARAQAHKPLTEFINPCGLHRAKPKLRR